MSKETAKQMQRTSEDSDRELSFGQKVVKRAAIAVSLIEKILLYASGFLIVVLSFLLSYEIVQRKVLSKSLLGIEELFEMAMICIAFMCLGYIQKMDGHINVDVVYATMKSRRLKENFKRILLSINCLFYGVFCYVSSNYVKSMLDAGEFTDVLHLPKSYFYCVMPIASFFCLLRCVMQLKEQNKQSGTNGSKAE